MTMSHCKNLASANHKPINRDSYIQYICQFEMIILIRLHI